MCCVAAYKGLYHNTGDFTESAAKIQKALNNVSIYKYLRKSYVPLFTKLAQTEDCEIWHSNSLYREGVQYYNIFLKHCLKYMKSIKKHYTHNHVFDIQTHIYTFVYGRVC